MIYMWFTGINYYKQAVEKDRDLYFYDHMETTLMKRLKENRRGYF